MLEWSPSEAKEMKSVVRAFRNLRVLLVGDLILDRWVEGTIRRISREAPVFIIEYENESTGPGGAANTAVQLKKLGADVIVMGWLGGDEEGRRILHLLQQNGVRTDGVVIVDEASTVVKTRFVAGSPYSVKQQVMRLDRGRMPEHSASLVERWREHFARLVDDTGCVVVSDYGYGSAEESWVRSLIQECRNRQLPLFGDSRFHLARFQGATAVTPNEPEFSEATGIPFNHAHALMESAVTFRKRWELDALLVTRGSAGMVLAIESGVITLDIFGPEAPVDVTGAGDTVLAVFSMASTISGNYPLSAKLATIAGGLSVMHKGAYAVSADELLQAIDTHTP